jgi:hypothetical protein
MFGPFYKNINFYYIFMKDEYLPFYNWGQPLNELVHDTNLLFHPTTTSTEPVPKLEGLSYERLEQLKKETNKYK